MIDKKSIKKRLVIKLPLKIVNKSCRSSRKKTQNRGPTELGLEAQFNWESGIQDRVDQSGIGIEGNTAVTAKLN